MSNLDYKQSYRRNLPHIQPRGATFFITFRLAGSLPQSVVDKWKKETLWLQSLERKDPRRFELYRLEFERRWFAKFEALLDAAAHGPVWLKDDRIAAHIADSLHYRDGKCFRLDAYSIMPNHVHVVFKPIANLTSSRSWT